MTISRTQNVCISMQLSETLISIIPNPARTSLDPFGNKSIWQYPVLFLYPPYVSLLRFLYRANNLKRETGERIA